MIFDIDVVYIEGVPYLNRDDLVTALESVEINSRNLFIMGGLLDLAQILREMALPEPTEPS